MLIIGLIGCGRIANFVDEKEYDRDVDEASTNPASVYGFGQSGYYSNVIDTLQGKSRPSTGGLEGRKSLYLLEQIYHDK